jgi:hypothetical protein
VGNDAKQAVAADGEREEFWMLAAAAGAHDPIGIDKHEGFDVVDERRKGETAAVNVSGQRPADRDFVDPGLLLPNGPGLCLALLRALEIVDERRPLHAGANVDVPPHPIERNDVLEVGHVHQDSAGAKLLAAHRMAATGDAHLQILCGGRLKLALNVFDGLGRDDPVDRGPIQLRLDVVDDNA